MVKIITRAEAMRIASGDDRGSRRRRAKAIGEVQAPDRESARQPPTKGKALSEVFADEVKQRRS